MKLQNKIFIGLILGILFGYFFKDLTLSFCPIVGEIFIRLLMMLIVPLVFASMVVGIGSVGDIRSIGKIGYKTFLYFVITTMIAVTIGLILVNITNPGIGTNISLAQNAALAAKAPDSLVNTIVQIIPKNIFTALTHGNMLSIILFSLLVGAALTTIGDKGKTLYSFFSAVNDAMMKVTDWVMNLAPYGVFALIASTIAESGLAAFKPLTVYIVTILIGLAIQSIIVLPAIVMIIGKYNPLTLMKKMIPALITVFTTASSAATLPITMDCLKKEVGISDRVIGFLIPLGTTMNMNGTALFQGVAVCFFAQIYGIKLTLFQMLVIIITATLAAIAAAGIPSAGFITMVIIMNAVNIPIEGIGFILGVDRVLDMFRSTVNLWGNATAALVVAKLEGESV
jgi:Na+/H+-dicarboxylate symporter